MTFYLLLSQLVSQHRNNHTVLIGKVGEFHSFGIGGQRHSSRNVQNVFIQHNRYELVEGAEDKYLFIQSTSEQPMASKDMSNLMKQSSEEELKCRYTMRSLRSGHICQALLTCILRYGIIKDNIRQAIKRHVGWNHEDSIDAYERMSIFCSQNVANLQDQEQSNEAQDVIRSYFHMDNVSSPFWKPVSTCALFCCFLESGGKMCFVFFSTFLFGDRESNIFLL